MITSKNAVWFRKFYLFLAFYKTCGADMTSIMRNYCEECSLFSNNTDYSCTSCWNHYALTGYAALQSNVSG